MAEQLLLPLFILNFVLVLVDASLGYHLAPHLIAATATDEPDHAITATRTIRRLLTGVVILYTFFNCLAYYRWDLSLMAIVTVLILADLGGQLYMRHRSRQHEEEE